MNQVGEVVLGIDLGTTATKVVAVDAAYRPVSTVERPAPLRTGRNGEAVHDPATVLAGAALVTCRRPAHRPHLPARCDGRECAPLDASLARWPPPRRPASAAAPPPHRSAAAR